jgi:hypothetical protein
VALPLILLILPSLSLAKQARKGGGIFLTKVFRLISGQVTHQRRGAADRGEYRQAAGVAEPLMV